MATATDYPDFIKRNGFERSLDEKSDETLLNILDTTLKACNLEIAGVIQQLILHFTPFSKISDATDVITSLESYPMEVPNLERVDDILVVMKDKVVRKRIADLANSRIQTSLDKKIQTMHPFWYVHHDFICNTHEAVMRIYNYLPFSFSTGITSHHIRIEWHMVHRH